MFLARLRRYADLAPGWGHTDEELATPDAASASAQVVEVAPAGAPAPHVPDVEVKDVDSALIVAAAHVRRAALATIAPFRRAWHFVANHTFRPLARRLGVEESFLLTILCLFVSLLLVLLIQNGHLLIGLSAKTGSLSTANVLMRTARQHKDDVVEQTRDKGWDATENPVEDLRMFMEFCREGMTNLKQQEAAAYRREDKFEYRQWNGQNGFVASPPPPISGHITANDCLQWMVSQLHLQNDMMTHISQRDIHVENANERARAALQSEHQHKAVAHQMTKENQRINKAMVKNDKETHKIAMNFKKITQHAMPASSRIGQMRAGMWEKWRKSGLTTDSHVIPAHAPKHPVG